MAPGDKAVYSYLTKAAGDHGRGRRDRRDPSLKERDSSSLSLWRRR
ncbi:MAG: hypothetical protein M3019_01115 [Candidatus Dormibacteraeota bacterium]|nr:hypothetical protein [Candidatus Dormibacteraeota bacterium]